MKASREIYHLLACICVVISKSLSLLSSMIDTSFVDIADFDTWLDFVKHDVKDFEQEVVSILLLLCGTNQQGSAAVAIQVTIFAAD